MPEKKNPMSGKKLSEPQLSDIKYSEYPEINKLFEEGFTEWQAVKNHLIHLVMSSAPWSMKWT